ncbi:fumarylacetoacetate hydrolase family protein [Clostridium beijerinckii]|uniref:fumarylacetoacetate hydrolase family protein n=1 Tax=Clostridium beijerinckii TaxID=1520 RepID=UPI00080A1757|nr:fumarylacetoacetate hydrolase family protein [Clostridium beijerinckii]OCA98353.1 fumarylacetoacetate hydrolase [Clostridium beijerinckii]
MKIKKLLMDNQGTMSLAIQRDDNWIVLRLAVKEIKKNHLLAFCDDLIYFLQYRETHMDEIDEIILSASSKSFVRSDMTEVMVFKPILYRDFMLSERHVINNGRGMVKNCMASAYPILKAYEFITRHTFPPIKPKKAYYENPVYYKGNHLSFVGSGSEVSYPDYATVLDYELELGMIITKEIRNADEKTALDSIGAFCVFNDFSARNVQIPEMRQTGFGPCKAKDFASSISNVVVTPDEILPYIETLKTRVIINNKIVATSQMNEFIFPLGQAVAYASKGETVYAGEFMGSGTIANCSGLENGYLLENGDIIRLEIDRIGFVENVIKSKVKS